MLKCLYKIIGLTSIIPVDWPSFLSYKTKQNSLSPIFFKIGLNIHKRKKLNHAVQGEMMISSTLSFEEFLGAVADRGYLDTIYLAEQEATWAERLSYSSQVGNEPTKEKYKEYASVLKDFIFFLRYGNKPWGINEKSWRMFISFCESLFDRMRIPPPCYESFSKKKSF